MFSELAAKFSFLKQTLEIPRAGKAAGRKVLAVRKQVLDVGLELNPGQIWKLSGDSQAPAGLGPDATF